ncbi:MAG: Fe-S cluster assembly ATPase SufC [Candidatus Micrarchaeaceae archaeon]
MILELDNLHAGIDGNEIIKGVNITIKSGEIHVLMGPNGSGKTTLANIIFGHPKYKIMQGDIRVDGKSVIGMKPHERAKLGLFMQFQNPVEADGVGFIHFMRAAKENIDGKQINFKDFMDCIKKYMKELDMSDEFINRPLNMGFSGGEKKKSEILQMLMLKPRIALLDEPDSGLDIDALKRVATAINSAAKSSNMGLLLITHYSRILSYIKPEYVHVMVNGAIVASGGVELVKKLEEEGYDSFAKQV